MKQQKILVAYFSRAGENYGVGEVEVGNTELLAREIVTALRADEFQIRTAQAYPQDYQDTVAMAERELAEEARPELAGEIDLAPYDVVFLGYPIWCGDLPMAIYSFLDQQQWDGMIVIPFCTHEGSGSAGTYQKLRTYLPEATVVLSGLEVVGRAARTAAGQAQVRPWLMSLGF